MSMLAQFARSIAGQVYRLYDDAVQGEADWSQATVSRLVERLLVGGLPSLEEGPVPTEEGWYEVWLDDAWRDVFVHKAAISFYWVNPRTGEHDVVEGYRWRGTPVLYEREETCDAELVG
jgi:hypothetical protein